MILWIFKWIKDVSFNTFIVAHNVRQVHYAPYPSSCIDKRGWCVAINAKLEVI